MKHSKCKFSLDVDLTIFLKSSSGTFQFIKYFQIVLKIKKKTKNQQQQKTPRKTKTNQHLSVNIILEVQI